MSDSNRILSEGEEVEEASSENRRKSYSIQLKKEAVIFARKTNISRAAIKYGVHRSCIQKWTKNYEKFNDQVKNGQSKSKRVNGGGRHLKDEDFEKKMINWIREQREKKMRVSRRSIKLHAVATNLDPDFVGSNGWLERFLLRHNLVARRATTVCQKPPALFIEKIIDFILYVEKMVSKNKYDFMYACDETAVYLDFSKTMTVEKKGSRQVSVRSTGHDKLHVTVMLCARNDGYKCRPFVLLPNKRPILDIIKQFGSKLELCWAGRTFFNDQNTEEFLRKVLGNSLFGKRLLVWDSYRCHISLETMKTLRELRIDTATIPGGTTKFLQAGDVYWNAPFKAKIRQLYEDWMLHGLKTFTAGGNMRAPPMEEYLKWIVEAWENLPVELIRTSFKGCALNKSTDGSEDHLIHCLKQDGEMPEGLALLKRCREERDEEGLRVLLEEADISDMSEDSDSPLDFDE